MGGLTLVHTPTSPERQTTTTIKTLAWTEAPNQLAMDITTLTSQIQSHTPPSAQQHAHAPFSIPDSLVPGLQPKAWDDWQVTDELNPFASSPDSHELTLQFGLDMWGLSDSIALGIPADQAYDEFIFDLAPSNFATPATVNVADLLVGPDSMAPVVAPFELTIPSMDSTHYNYQDFALANLYGFTEKDVEPSDSHLGSDLSAAELDTDYDNKYVDMDEETAENVDDKGKVLASGDRDMTDQTGLLEVNLNAAVEMSMGSSELHQIYPTHPTQTMTEAPNKRHMEEELAMRIGSDLGPEHMAGLFEILKRSSSQSVVSGNAHDDDDNNDDDNNDDEVQVDLSRFDETTLVELYHYVEMCCMQTVRSILNAEERERKRALTEAKAEKEAMERQCWTPELSPSHSTASSSSSPSPPYPSSPVHEYSSGNNWGHSTSALTACTTFYEHSGVEEQVEARWMTAQHRPKRKRASKNDPTCMGGGGTSKGRRKQRSFEMGRDDTNMGEDDEIDIVGF
ncbi:MAG: hypothetical protein J3Q66DRAFT_358212 [Benniella sp.]|nr:MAG: hypothetical protein J3Q66DRAFT_358212 [Benniella sp.]